MNCVHSVTLDGAGITKQRVMGTGMDEFEDRRCLSSMLGLGIQVGFHLSSHVVCGQIILGP